MRLCYMYPSHCEDSALGSVRMRVVETNRQMLTVWGATNISMLTSTFFQCVGCKSEVVEFFVFWSEALFFGVNFLSLGKYDLIDLALFLLGGHRLK
jgi:hypothetical protein